jgi:ParB/RepB/Spo0J family partition protein
MATASATRKSEITEILEIILEIPTERLAPSPTNPRTHFPADYLEELAASITANRQVQAGVVRPWTATQEDVIRARAAGLNPSFGPGDEMYRIVAGECRARACALVEKPFRAECVDMEDTQEEGEQIVENLRRRDLDPLDEAQGYKNLMDKGWTLQMIADRIGDMERSIKYVSAVARLTSLTEEGKTILRNGWTSRGHAILVARLEPEDQERAWRAVFDFYGQNKKVPLLELAERVQDREFAGYQVLTEKATREWIKTNVNLQLKNAKWELDDETLYPEAGACTACPHKSGNNQALFSDIADSDEECLKPACWQEKGKRFVQIQIACAETVGRKLMPISVEKASYHAPKPGQRSLKQGQWLPARKGECASVEEAVEVDGATMGATRLVCADGSCKKHQHQWALHAATGSPAEGSGGAQGGAGGQGGTKFDVEALERQRVAEQAKREAEEKVESEMVLTVLRAEIRNRKKADKALLVDVADHYMQTMEIDVSAIALALGVPQEKDPYTAVRKIIETRDEGTVAAILAMMMLGDYVEPESDAFAAMAKRNKVDLKKLRKELQKKLTAKDAKDAEENPDGRKEPLTTEVTEGTKEGRKKASFKESGGTGSRVGKIGSPARRKIAAIKQLVGKKAKKKGKKKK